MNRQTFLGTAGAFGTIANVAPSGPAGAEAPRIALPRAAHRFFTDFDMNYVFLGVLGGAYYGLADVGTTLAIIDQTQDGNAASAFAALTSAGEGLRARAEAALAAGDRATARECFLQSSNYTFAATYFCDGMHAPEKLIPTWAQSRAAMDAAFALFDPPVERVKVPYEGTTLPGYFFKVDSSEKPRPLLIMVNGSDGSVLDMWLFGAAAGVRRGYNCITVDGPGQGAALFEQHLTFRPDWEKVITPVVDFVLQRPDVDPRRIAIEGISQGGYWVPRAIAFEHRISAAIVDPGVVDVATSWLKPLPPAAIALLDSGNKQKFDAIMSGNSPLAATLAFRSRPFGLSSPFDLYTAVRTYALAGLLDKIRCPMLIANPDGEQFWPGQSQQLYDGLPGPKTMANFTVAEGAQYHCEPMARGLVAQRFFDWLDATLAYNPGRAI